jgi:hypothetical protein
VTVRVPALNVRGRRRQRGTGELLSADVVFPAHLVSLERTFVFAIQFLATMQQSMSIIRYNVLCPPVTILYAPRFVSMTAVRGGLKNQFLYYFTYSAPPPSLFASASLRFLLLLLFIIIFFSPIKYTEQSNCRATLVETFHRAPLREYTY